MAPREQFLRGILGPDGEKYANANDLVAWLKSGLDEPAAQFTPASAAFPHMIEQLEFWNLTVGEGVFGDGFQDHPER